MSDIVVFNDGKLEVAAKVENETIWVTQKQLCELFGRDKSVISRHINNIFKSGELDREAVVAKNATTAADGKVYQVDYYNLDLIIAVGYRVNSKKATQFRIWATGVLKEYILKGYALDKERLRGEKLHELTQTLALIKQGLENSALSLDEAKGFVQIVTDYARSWALLQGYDEQTLPEVAQTKEQKFILDYDEAIEAIAELKRRLMAKGEATELFGREKANEFQGHLLAIYQSFGGEELLPSVEQKAANLLYYIIKGHPFNDGNKRIGAYLFILFLHKNGILYRENGEPKINDNALASLALLVAASDPAQKEIIIRLIMNMLYEGEL
jgi:prophage maintenance system killer protein